MTIPPPPPPPPLPPPPPKDPDRRRWHRRLIRAVALGLLTGLVLLIGLSYALTSGLGARPTAADVCAAVPSPALDDPYAEVTIETACRDIDTTLDEPISGPDGFEGDFRFDEPPSDPALPRPAYLVWESDGCSAPVLGRGPFDFTLACNRHDFGWRNLKQLHRDDDVPTWQIENKDRVDAGFLYDMRVRCAAVPAIVRIGCETTARVYYTAVRLNPSGVQGIPGGGG